MPTNLAIDDRLLEQALKIGGKKTKRETVNAALMEFVQYRKRLDAVELFGKITFDPKFNYRRARDAR